MSLSFDSSNTIFFAADNIAEFDKIAHSLEDEQVISRIAQNTLKGNSKDTVGVKLGDKEIVYYSKADYHKILTTLKLYHEHAKGTQDITLDLKDLYESLSFVPSVNKEALQEFRDAIDAGKQSLSQIPENIKPLLEAFQVIDAIEARLTEYQIALLPTLSKTQSTDSVPYGEDIATPPGSPIPLPPPLESPTPRVEEPSTPELNPEIENNPSVVALKESIAMLKELKANSPITESALNEKGFRSEDLPSLIENLENAFSSDGIYAQDKIKGNELLETMAWYTRSLISNYQDLEWRLKEQNKVK